MSSLIRTGKEIARHAMHKVGLRRRRAHLKGDRSTNFKAIYEEGTWQHGDEHVPGSGEGSTLAATVSLRRELPAVLEELGAKALLGIGRGVFTWMEHVELPCGYVGVDIVESVIEQNAERHGAPNRRFLVADVVAERPEVDADVVLCREVLFHLSLADGQALLRNALASGVGHFLLTSDTGTAFNADIDSGDFRLLNLEKRPFGLPAPKRRIDDSGVCEGRFVGLWTAQDIAAVL